MAIETPPVSPLCDAQARHAGRMPAAMGWRRAAAVWSAAALAALLAFAAALSLGAVTLGPAHWWAWLHGTDSREAGRIVAILRLPRALAGFTTGALLSLAGALLQALLANPLADPYVLGVSGGAAVCALLALSLAAPAGLVALCAFGGALASMLFVLALARRAFGPDPTRLLLTGVVFAAGCAAALTLLLSLAESDRLRAMVFWLAGDLSGADMPYLALAVLPLLLLFILPAAPALNVLLRGDDMAQALGVPVRRLRLRVYLVASLATATAVTTAGTVGFVGLVVPHLLRLAFGNDQRMLLPASVLLGGALVLLADLLARTLVAPLQLPLGAVTGALGAPVFLALLWRGQR